MNVTSCSKHNLLVGHKDKHSVDVISGFLLATGDSPVCHSLAVSCRDNLVDRSMKGRAGLVYFYWTSVWMPHSLKNKCWILACHAKQGIKYCGYILECIILLINSMLLNDGLFRPAVIMWKHCICETETCASSLMYADWLTTEANSRFLVYC